MLRMYVVQQCFGFSDEGCEDAVYDSQAIRGFMGIDLGRESAPDATTLLRFRRLLETHRLTRVLFETINLHLAGRGLLFKEGTIVDATLIAAPPSVKNREGKRDPEMHQAKKGNQWHFGMKAHIGVDATSGLVHSVVGTAANVADVTQVDQLLHGAETYVSGDAGYTGTAKRPEHAERDVIWSIAARPSSYKQHGEGSVLYRVKRKIEYAKAQLRAKVEHPFQVIKVRFNHRKVLYRGLEKNTAQLFQSVWVGQSDAGQAVFATGGGINPSERRVDPQISKMRAKIGPGNANKAGRLKKTGLEMGAVRTG
uniref:Putative transposase n=1 Tax=Pseudomonas sp. JR1 TaxID=47160 RepID=Q9KJZ9_9PSED|nr:putative transposase [Pseudomonas sp. JR1]AAK83005.1 putative transposase [Pseudomonas sp. JR1]